jgi:hypothetical protein
VACQSLEEVVEKGAAATERMPKYKRELRYLFPLLAQFQQRGFAGVLVEKVGYIGHGAAIVFRNQRLVIAIVSMRIR